MAEINVRLINGESLVINASDQINVKQLRELLAEQKPNLAACQLYHYVSYSMFYTDQSTAMPLTRYFSLQGSIIKSSVGVASLCLQPGDFLVSFI
jgi:hypothetical protein